MNIVISIDYEACISCRRCVAVCPSMLFAMNDKHVEVEQKGCIECGHCVAVCPRNAIRHSSYKASDIRAVDRSAFPSAHSLMELIKSRRSNRQFTAEPVPQEAIDKIVEAARFAPTASNSRDVEVVVYMGRETIGWVTDATMKIFNSMLALLDNPVVRPLVRVFSPHNYSYIGSFRKMRELHASGGDPILHCPYALILFVTPNGSRFGVHDANLAYENASLMAEALGLAHFYTGFVCVSSSMKRRQFAKKLGIKGVVSAGMAVGMPAYKFENYIER